MERFKNFLAVLTSLLLLILWLLPGVFIYVTNESGFGALYVCVFILSILWGIVIQKYYY